MFGTKSEFLVSISYTGRIVIPKFIRQKYDLAIKDVLLILKETPGFLSIMPVKQSKKELSDVIYKLANDRTKKPFFLEWGICMLESGFRIFIPKSYREFASIEESRKSSAKGILILINHFDQIEIWSKKRRDALFKEYYEKELGIKGKKTKFVRVWESNILGRKAIEMRRKGEVISTEALRDSFEDEIIKKIYKRNAVLKKSK